MLLFAGILTYAIAKTGDPERGWADSQAHNQRQANALQDLITEYGGWREEAGEELGRVHTEARVATNENIKSQIEKVEEELSALEDSDSFKKHIAAMTLNFDELAKQQKKELHTKYLEIKLQGLRKALDAAQARAAFSDAVALHNSKDKNLKEV